MESNSASLLFFFIIIIILSSSTISSESLVNEGDQYLALKSLKNHLIIQNPNSILSTWNDSINFCSWKGVSCGGGGNNRVRALKLVSEGLSGSLPAAVGNLTFLERIDLSLNWFSGTLPPSIGNLQNLNYLNLSFNSLAGAIPANMTRCGNLRELDLSGNRFSSSIPDGISSLSKLLHLDISNNSLAGSIPATLGNLSSLENLLVGRNQFNGGIPVEIGRLTKLRNLNVYSNSLTGIIPDSIYNLSTLFGISMADNDLSGGFSTNSFESLRNLNYLYLGGNNLNGSIVVALSNATSLSEIDLGDNNFTGKIPFFDKFGDLTFLNLGNNQLGNGRDDWRFIDSLANCTDLQVLSINMNLLTGTLPRSIGNLSTHLKFWSLGSNLISGTIPSEILNLVGLELLTMEFNFLQGFIPHGIGNLALLQTLSFGRNQLAGDIPSSIGNLTKLTELDLGENQLTGIIPASFGSLQNLNFLSLGFNNLNGSLPKELFTISTLSKYLGLSQNSFNGALPPEIGRLVNLETIDLSHNNLFGEIPENLGSCTMLSTIQMQKNYFNGTIPSALSKLQGLQTLDFSNNNFSGTIPFFFQNMKALNLLNLSYNNLQGQVPDQGIFQNATAISLAGNPEICGGIPELQFSKCGSKGSPAVKKNKLYYLPKVLILVASLLVVLGTVSCITALLRRKQRLRKKPSLNSSSPQSSFKESFPRISQAELAKATNGFSSANLIGRGRCGLVYRGTLGSDGTAAVAVKVFDLDTSGAAVSFATECTTLRSIRHRNVIKVITSCSSIDSGGGDFKALVLELMPMGNLDGWLHPEKGGNSLSLTQRLNIAVGVADALDYLHHNCQPPIIHCDIKPANILLDNDMNPRVADFEISKMIPEDAGGSIIQDQGVVSGMRGTIGYVAPEYGAGKPPSTSGDVYSYGILLLEMVTGRRPTDEMFEEGLSLYKFVETAYNGHILNIVDQTMSFDGIEDGGMSYLEQEKRISECLVSVVAVGLQCSRQRSEERICMRDTAAEIYAIRDVYLYYK